MAIYEGMFLADPAKASTEWEEVMKHVTELIGKHGGKILQSTKWAERKLTYPIKRRNRGTYILTYFEAPPESITKIKDDFKLSEIILRTLILAKEGKEATKILAKPLEPLKELPPMAPRNMNR
ncbi:MAG: 30S ribosomal protein S6 [Planctomycetes bacterium]|nr:30S ribosomal protein S6 [Planctomycetota bacterium]